MKKRIIKSGSIALAITTLMCLVNWVLGKTYEKIIGIKIWGGDVADTYGFGVKLQKLYPEYHVDNPIDPHITVSIAPINFILTVITLSIVVYFIYLITEKRKNRSSEKMDKV